MIHQKTISTNFVGKKIVHTYSDQAQGSVPLVVLVEFLELLELLWVPSSPTAGLENNDWWFSKLRKKKHIGIPCKTVLIQSTTSLMSTSKNKKKLSEHCNNTPELKKENRCLNP